MTMENFAQLLEESFTLQEMNPGEVITAEVVGIDQNFVTVNAGLKSESLIDVAEFKNAQGEIEVKVGDFVTVTIESVENGFGETKLSREKAKRAADWIALEEAMENGDILSGVINGKVKGGLTVMINSIRAFLPGSLVDVRPVKDTSHFEGKEIEFKVIKLDKKRNNVVVSRRAVLEATLGEERKALLENLQEGSVIKGIVKNITDYGAFVDLGGIDGLLHITDLAWRRVKHPSEVLEVGQEVEAKVLKFDQDKQRVSLGMKQLGEDPWSGLTRRYPQGTRLFGKVSNLTDYGAFVEIEQGIEGLVHVSEMDWTNKNVHPSKVVQLGDEVEVMILEIDEDRRRISLGMKQCQANPWEEFAANHNKGDKISGAVKSITDFGVFVGLPGGIDGLLHITDLAWRRVKHPSEVLEVGQEVEAKVLKFDQDKQRVSLGIKQLGEDPWSGLARRYPQGTRLFGKVSNLTDYGAFVEIEQGIEGLVHVSEMDWTNKNVHPSKVVQLGDEVEVMILEIDEDRRRISLGMKQCQANPWEEFAANHNKGDKISGAVKSITDFGVFVGLPGNIDGLVHLSDLSWTESGEEAVSKYKKGEEVEAVVLAIDVDKERISLGIKQLEGDPFGNFISVNDKGSLVKGTVKSVDAKGAVIALSDEVEGYLPAAEWSSERVEDLRNVVKEGDEVEAIVATVDRKNRSIRLSVKAKDAKENREALNSVNAAATASAGTTSLGDLLKAKLSGDQE